MLNKNFQTLFCVRWILVSVAGLFFWGCQGLWHPSNSVDVIQSPNDERLYRYIELPNRLKVLLISDGDALQAAASLDVHVGSRNDPVSKQGLAHFLEHMLFLGTEKYPKPDSYQKFISQHGGTHNAFTSFEHTNYYFSIESSQLDEALDRFSDFFVEPLFDSVYISREINAVESEYRAKIDDPYRQILEAMQQLMNPEHPFRQLSVGNLQTLNNEGLREELVSFFQRFYSGSRMSLSVTGDFSLDTLETMVRERFSKIKNNNTAMQHKDGRLFDIESVSTLPKKLEVKTQKPLRQLQLVFPLPDLKHYYRFKPVSYIGDVLGYEGPGSVLSALKAKNLVESLSVGMGVSLTGESLLQITINLTAEGLSLTDYIVDGIFVALHKMRVEQKNKPDHAQARYQELAQIASNRFRFYEKSSEISAVIAATSNLHFYPPAEVFFGDYNFLRYEQSVIDKFLSLLIPDNLLMVIASNEFNIEIVSDDTVSKASNAPWRVTPWYAADYRVNNMPSTWLHRWRNILDSTFDNAVDARAHSENSRDGKYEGEHDDSELVLQNQRIKALRAAISLPGLNPYVPSDFTLFASGKKRDKSGVDSVNTEFPELVFEEPGFQFWKKTDDDFEVPKADLLITFFSKPDFNIDSNLQPKAQTAKYQALSNLYARIMDEQLNEFTYQAAQAGSYVRFDTHLRGFSLALRGYNDGMVPLLQKTLASIQVLTLREERFDALRKELIRRWSAAAEATPYRRLGAYIGAQMFEGNWDYDDLIKALDLLTYSDVQSFSRALWSEVFTVGMLHGNVDTTMTSEVVEALKILEGCRCALKDKNTLKILKLNQGVAYADMHLKHSDAAARWYFQAADDSGESIATVMLATSIANPLFYNKLRTEQQLGYIVSASDFTLHKWPGFHFTVQSPSSSETKIVEAMREFVLDFIANPVDAKTFESHKESLLAHLSKEDNNLRLRSQRYWHSLMLGEQNFDWRKQRYDYVQKMDYARWLVLVRKMLGAQERHSLLVTTALQADQQKENSEHPLGQQSVDANTLFAGVHSWSTESLSRVTY